MDQKIRAAHYDRELQLEAHRFRGITQPFPNHFHDYYVIGFVESGRRQLCCRNKEYDIVSGDILLFQPGDNHSCTQTSGTLDYCSLNISQDTMEKLAKKATGMKFFPVFTDNVFRDRELLAWLKPLHQMIMDGFREFQKEEYLLFFIMQLIEKYGHQSTLQTIKYREEIEKACSFILSHYAEPLSLGCICDHVGLSKSTLLRSFTKYKGITPYRFLETVRIGEAKKLLEQGVSPAETALRTGFTDQSHLTNRFRSQIGLTPGMYRSVFTGSPAESSDSSNEPEEKPGNIRVRIRYG